VTGGARGGGGSGREKKAKGGGGGRAKLKGDDFIVQKPKVPKDRFGNSGRSGPDHWGVFEKTPCVFGPGPGPSPAAREPRTPNSPNGFCGHCG